MAGAEQISAVIQPVGDLRVKRELAALLEGGIRYHPARGCWMRWESPVWRPLTDQQMLDIAAETLFTQAKHRIVHAGRLSKAEVEELYRSLRDACSRGRLANALAFLAGDPKFHTVPERWDAEPWLLNCRNGVLDLRMGKVLDSDPSLLFTKIFNANIEPQATCPRWEKHLTLCLPDADVRRTVQRQLGLALVGAHLTEGAAFWIGNLGANGKSTTLKVMLSLFGDYAYEANLDLLVRKPHETHPTALAHLKGKRLVVVSETERGARLAETRLKVLTGGDPVTARHLYQDYHTFNPTWQVILVGNYLPRIRGQDGALWRRIQLVPWHQRIPEDVQRPQEEVVEELIGEAPGILHWLVKGLADWQRDRGWQAQAVEGATREYKSESDILAPFIDEYCETGVTCEGEFKNIYEAYLRYCEDVGIRRPLSRRAFSEELRSRGFESEKIGKFHITVLRGIQLRSRIDANQSNVKSVRENESQKVTERRLASVRHLSESASQSHISGTGGVLSRSDSTPLEDDVPEWVDSDVL